MGTGIGQTSLNQTIGHKLFQILAGAGLHPGGDFFGEEFNQQIRHGMVSPFYSSYFSFN